MQSYARRIGRFALLPLGQVCRSSRGLGALALPNLGFCRAIMRGMRRDFAKFDTHPYKIVGFLAMVMGHGNRHAEKQRRENPSTINRGHVRSWDENSSLQLQPLWLLSLFPEVRTPTRCALPLTPQRKATRYINFDQQRLSPQIFTGGGR